MVEVKVIEENGRKHFHGKTSGEIGEIIDDTAIIINQIFQKINSADTESGMIFAHAMIDHIEDIIFDYEGLSGENVDTK